MARRNVHRTVVTLSFALLAQTATVAGAAESHPCSRVQEDAARLACYDHAFGVGGAATPTTAAPSGAPAATTAVPATVGTSTVAAVDSELKKREAFGLSEAARAARTPDKVDAPLDRIEGKVASLGRRATGELLVTLEDGQVWTQIESDSKATFRVGDTVTIRKASLGSYLMVSSTRVATRVRRVK